VGAFHARAKKIAAAIIVSTAAENVAFLHVRGALKQLVCSIWVSARRDPNISNQLFEILAEWNNRLKRNKLAIQLAEELPSPGL